MRYFVIFRKDFGHLYPDIPIFEQPNRLIIYEDGTAYGKPTDNCWFDADFFSTTQKSFEECAKNFGVEIYV